MTKKKAPHELRSQQWFGRQDRDGFAYRSWVKGKSVPHDQFDGRPVIGICNTFSEHTPCNSHVRTLAEQVKICLLYTSTGLRHWTAPRRGSKSAT